MTDPAPMGDPSVCPPTSSIIPPFIPALLRRCLSPLYVARYTLTRVEANPPSRTVLRSARDTPRPSSASSRSTARLSDDSFGDISGSDDESSWSNKDALGMVMTNSEADSGLRWNRVTPALNLLHHAGYEAQQPHCDTRLVRALYLNAITYLLSALPEDMTNEEAATIRRSLPEKLKTSLLATRSPSQSSSAGPGNSHSPPPRSYLHRLLASSIVCFCLLLQFLMPFIKVVLLQLYQYERSLRLTERATVLALYVVDHVSKSGVSIASTLLNMHDGKPGDAAMNVASWWVEGIAGGIYEGVGEGMAILGFAGPYSELPQMNKQRE